MLTKLTTIICLLISAISLKMPWYTYDNNVQADAYGLMLGTWFHETRIGGDPFFAKILFSPIFFVILINFYSSRLKGLLVKQPMSFSLLSCNLFLIGLGLLTGLMEFMNEAVTQTPLIGAYIYIFTVSLAFVVNALKLGWKVAKLSLN